MLANKTYIGKIEHNNKIYEGKHEGIIDKELFNKVQEILQHNSLTKKHSLYTETGSLLASLIYNAEGNRMTPISGSGGKTQDIDIILLRII